MLTHLPEAKEAAGAGLPSAEAIAPSVAPVAREAMSVDSVLG